MINIYRLTLDSANEQNWQLIASLPDNGFDVQAYLLGLPNGQYIAERQTNTGAQRVSQVP